MSVSPSDWNAAVNKFNAELARARCAESAAMADRIVTALARAQRRAVLGAANAAKPNHELKRRADDARRRMAEARRTGGSASNRGNSRGVGRGVTSISGRSFGGFGGVS